MQVYGRALAAGVAMAAWVGIAFMTFLLSRNEVMIALMVVISAGVLALLPFMRAYLRAFALVLIAFVAGIGLLEASLRIKYFGVDALAHPTRYGPYSEVLGTGIVRPLEDPRLIYGMTPGLRTRFMGYPLEVNAQGFRGRDFMQEKAERTRRVLALGTSITMGGGVAVEDAYPAVLERLLSARGDKVEVYNCGVPAYPSALRFNLAEVLVARYHPDDVVVEIRGGAFYDTGDVSQLARGFAQSNATLPPISSVERYSFAASGLYPPISLRQRIHGLLARVGVRSALAATPTVVSTASTAYLQSRVRDLVELGRRNGFRVYLLFTRPMFGFDDPRMDLSAREELTDGATRLGATVVDTYPAFDAGEFPDDFQVFPGDNHPNAAAHARYAHTLAKKMN